MYKIVSVAVLPSWGTTHESKNTSYREFEFPTVQKYLDEGYKVQDIHHAIPNGISTVLLTFVLVK